MRGLISKAGVALLAGALLVTGSTRRAEAAIYAGNGATGFGGLVGNGSLSVADSGGNVTFTFNPNGSFNGNDLVVYIDSVPGGFTNNSTFFDDGDGGRESVSGSNTGNNSQSLVSFPAGFGADYALEFENTIYTGLFGLVSGGNNSLNFITGASPSGGTYSVTFPIADLGLSQGQSFNFVGTYTSTSAYRSNETIGASVTIPDNGGDAPNAGFSGSTTFTAADTYATTAVPEPTGLLAIAAAGLALTRRRFRA